MKQNQFLNLVNVIKLKRVFVVNAHFMESVSMSFLKDLATFLKILTPLLIECYLKFLRTIKYSGDLEAKCLVLEPQNFRTIF